MHVQGIGSLLRCDSFTIGWPRQWDSVLISVPVRCRFDTRMSSLIYCHPISCLLSNYGRYDTSVSAGQISWLSWALLKSLQHSSTNICHLKICVRLYFNSTQGIRKEELEITYSGTRLSRGTLLSSKARGTRCTCFSRSTNWTLVTPRSTKSFFTSSTRGTRRPSDTLWANGKVFYSQLIIIDLGESSWRSRY